MEPFDAYRRRLRSVRQDTDAAAGQEPSDAEPPAEYSFTAEQLLELVWKVAGASMAAIGVDRADMPAIGAMVAPTINEIVRDYGITVPENYSQSKRGNQR